MHVVLHKSTNLGIASSPRRFVASVIINSTVLNAEDPNYACTQVDESHCRIVIRGTRAASDTLASVAMLATLGNTDYAEITLERFSWEDSTVATVVQTENGSIHITGTCDEGGVRLVLASGVKQSLASRPNPAQGSVRIEYGLVESSVVNLDILNTSGQVVISPLVAASNNKGVNYITVDVSSLASGVYVLRLTTTSAVLTSRMQIMN
jgi:hypothetical protein